jgi:hypothetical protein
MGEAYLKNESQLLQDKVVITPTERNVYNVIQWDSPGGVELELVSSTVGIDALGGGSYVVPVPEFCTKWTYHKGSSPNMSENGLYINPSG